MVQIFPHGIMVWKGRRLGYWRSRLDHSGLMPSSSLKSADSWEEQRGLWSGSAMIRDSHTLPSPCERTPTRGEGVSFEALRLGGCQRQHGEGWRHQRRSRGFGPGTRGTGRGTGETVSFGHGSGVQKAGHGLITQQTEKPESCCVHWSSAKTSLSGERQREKRNTSNISLHHFGLVLWMDTGGRTAHLGRRSDFLDSVSLHRYKVRSLTCNVYVSKKWVIVVHWSASLIRISIKQPTHNKIWLGGSWNKNWVTWHGESFQKDHISIQNSEKNSDFVTWVGDVLSF